MAILKTGPLAVPTFVLPSGPCNILLVVLTNPTARTLTAFVQVDQAVCSLVNNQVPSCPWTVLLPPEPIRLAPNTATLIAVPLPVLDPPSRSVMVTVSGDVHKSGCGILVGISGGFAAPGSLLTLAEPTLHVRHEELVEVPPPCCPSFHVFNGCCC